MILEEKQLRVIVVAKDVPGTPEALFRTITSPPTWEHWFSIHRDFVGHPPEHLTEGSTLVTEVLLHGMTDTVAWITQTIDEPTRIVLRGTIEAGIHCELAYWLQATATGTTVTISAVISGPMVTAAAMEMIDRHGHQQLDRTLDQLAALACAIPG